MQIQANEVTQQQITQCIQLLKGVFGQDLLGVYLYGSSIVGGLQKYSDIDLFAVVNRPSTRAEKATIAADMLQISGVFLKSAKKPVELTIVVKSEVNPWQYPPGFDFLYGDWLRGKFETGVIEPWETKVMPDLALLISQVFLASETVYGLEPKSLLAEVPYRDFVTASTAEVDSLLAELEWDTRNVLLTLARIWSTLETDGIRSKPAAAAWAIERLPQEYKPVLQVARAVCLGAENQGWNAIEAKVKPCADAMVAKIKAQAAFLMSSDTTQRSIYLGEQVE